MHPDTTPGRAPKRRKPAVAWLLVLGLFACSVALTYAALVIFGREQLGWTSLCIIASGLCLLASTMSLRLLR